jgi:hypothetical protein
VEYSGWLGVYLGDQQRRGLTMKRMFSVLGLTVAAAITTPVQAQNYPWCEYLGSGMGGARNCGFVSYEQCMASAFGNGGDCRPNTLYTPPPGSHHSSKLGR